MKFAQVILITTALVGYTTAAELAYSAATSVGRFGGPGGPRPLDVNYPPQPYNFDYNAVDEEGNTHYRNEQGDQNGHVRGTYGYTDNQGLFRVVEYVADVNGFRANIRTNEPGVDGKESPADVVLSAQEPPAGIYESRGRPGRRRNRRYIGGFL